MLDAKNEVDDAGNCNKIRPQRCVEGSRRYVGREFTRLVVVSTSEITPAQPWSVHCHVRHEKLFVTAAALCLTTLITLLLHGGPRATKQLQSDDAAPFRSTRRGIRQHHDTSATRCGRPRRDSLGILQWCAVRLHAVVVKLS
uniref:Uncharacterized protein n=1 Tax=Hyaloperonospora arabidopsidis (strain Emoy2) TaxID=559515 RepID=M4BKN8_HYAAE